MVARGIHQCQVWEPHRAVPVGPHGLDLPEAGPLDHPGDPAADHEPKQTDAAKNVLVVDDDADLREVTRFALEGEGICVETAKNGEEALELLRAGELPVLVLLDLMMPVMNGWEFLDEVAKIPSLKAIPVVVLTAAEPTDVPGAVEVLRKPFGLGSLIAAVRRHGTRPG